MKKIVKIFSVALVVILIASVLASCGLGGGGNSPQKPSTDKNKTTGELKPSSITKLADIPNYSNTTKFPVKQISSYDDTTEQERKLTKRINSKKEEVDRGEDVSSITKIFAHSEATEIIEKMRVSGLPKDKMIATVDYMAGDEDTDVTAEQIDILVASGTFDKRDTAGWSFFDDYDYYEKLQDRVDELKDAGAADDEINNAEDNVKRQYRNMAGKVFALNMTGDEFARTVTNELEYATLVTESDDMAGSELSYSTTPGSQTPYDEYAKENLDYETLVYLRAFNQYRWASSTGFADCVELYGYYYDYNRTSYYSQTDEVFEKQLKYSHQKTYSDAEWWDYMTIQRNSYVNAYRYTYKFYTTYYNRHLAFQDISEDQENFVFGIEPWRDLSYTAEMRSAVSNNNFEGQLAMTDWTWCYNGNQKTMNDYNAANTKYQNNKNGTRERQKEGEFDYDIEQLKMVKYLLEKMTVTELAQMLRFQVYSYSSEMVESAQGYNKDKVYVEQNVKLPAEVINILEGLSAAEEKEYAVGKIDAILEQMNSVYNKANVESNAKGATNVAWKEMLKEINTALDYDYKGNITQPQSAKGVWELRVEKLEDLVVKRKYSCGAELDDLTCTKTPNNPHAECTKEYDTSHKISQFLNNYERIIRYMASQMEISFQSHKAPNDNNSNDYNIGDTVNSVGQQIERTVGYKDRTIRDDEIANIEYAELKTVTINSGKSFANALELNNDRESSEDKTWWTGGESKPAKADGTSTIKPTGSSQTHNYTYTYAWSGWYLDKEYKYVFDVNDEIKCDLELYAGYNCVKKRV